MPLLPEIQVVRLFTAVNTQCPDFKLDRWNGFEATRMEPTEHGPPYGACEPARDGLTRFGWDG